MATRCSNGREELLGATVASAVRLLRCGDLAQSVPGVLEALGTATKVDRMQLLHFRPDVSENTISCVTHFGWCAPGIPCAEGLKSIIGRDIIKDGFGCWAESFMRGEIVAGTVEHFDPVIRAFFEKDAVKSVVAVPIFVDEEWWGCIGFDSCRTARTWIGGEIDILKMLAEVIGVAVQRTRTLAELADANRIIESSKTILFRLVPTPAAAYSLQYVSSNIYRYGYSASELLAKPEGWPELIDPTDSPRVIDAIQSVGSGALDEVDTEFRLIGPDDSRIWFQVRAKGFRNSETGLTDIEGLVTDITERKQATLEIEKLASTDIVTGAANRCAFLRHLDQACDRANAASGLLAIHFIDLDGFKKVNDSHGHIVGDELLKAVAGRIESTVRKTDIVARFGGDEFAVLQLDPPSPAFAEATAQRICNVIAKPYKVGGKIVSIGASIGVDCNIGQQANGDAMLAHADHALYRAKAEGRNCARVYDYAADAHTGSDVDGKLRSPSAA